jgi:FkbM family methyltransferase
MYSWKYLVGKIVEKTNYRVVREDRIPTCTANLFLLGADLIFACRNSDNPVVIFQIGVFDGCFSDALEPILSKPGNYKAVLVEPQPIAFKSMLQKYVERADLICENCAVADKDGEVVLFTSPDSSTPFASILRSQRERVAQESGSVVELKVPALTAKSLLEKHGFENVDILMIDTEGYDFQVLNQFLKACKMFPKLIQLESYHLDKHDRVKLRVTLEERGYGFIDVGQDTVCYHRSFFR